MDSGALLDLFGNANRRRILRLLATRPCYVTEISEYLDVSPKAVIDHLERLEDAGLVEYRTDERRRKYFSITRNLRLEVQLSPYEFGTKSAYPTESVDVSECRYVSVEVDRTSDGDRADDADGEEERGASDADRSERVASDGERATGEAVADGVGTQPAGEDAATDARGTPEEPGDGTRTDAPPTGSADAGSEAPDRPALAPLARELARLERLTDELSLAQRWAQGRATKLRGRIGEAVDGGDGLGRLAAGLIGTLADGPADVEQLGRAVDAPPSVVEETLEVLAAADVVRRDGPRWRLDV